MSYPKPPWENLPGVDPNLLSTVQNAIQAGVQEGTELAGAVLAGQDVTVKTTEAIQDLGNSVITAGQAVTPVGGDWTSGIQDIAKSSAQGAIAAVLPALQDKLAHAAEKALAKEITDALGTTQPPLAEIPKGSLKKLDAWERAVRTFMAGLFVTILAGIAQVIGTLATEGGSVNFFTKEGWTVVGGLAIASVANSVVTYVLRYLREPVGAEVNSATPKPS